MVAPSLVCVRRLPRRAVRLVVLVLVLACFHSSYELYAHAMSGVPADAIRLPNKPGVVYWHGDGSRRAIALTFDDGPSPHTAELLEVLGQHDVKATFFMVGSRVDARPDVARAVAAAGHAIGNHTYHHTRLVLKKPAHVTRELVAGERAIERATGIRPAFYRPPFGAEDRVTREAGRRLGLVAVDWSGSSKDWKRPGADAIVANVLRQAHDGAVILMHDGGGDRRQTVEAVARIIPELRRRGFELVTVPELLEIPAVRAEQPDARRHAQRF
jgi:peptidoglycan-N-acetylglucosamine deacetylase